MKQEANKIIQYLYLVSFALFFIFNFIDRSVSNIFIIITLILCLVDYKRLYQIMIANSKLVICIFFFSFYIALLGVYHNSPFGELDNYFRFLFLLPLLSISLKESHIIKLISVCALSGLLHALYSNGFYDFFHEFRDDDHIYFIRYGGTSSTPATYANMCATLFIISIYYMLYKNNKPIYLMLSAFVFLTLYISTVTRGPIIGLTLAAAYLIYEVMRKNDSKISIKLVTGLISTFIIIMITVPNPLSERLRQTDINFSEPSKIMDFSLRERVYYTLYGLQEIKHNYLTGVAPQNVEDRLSEYLNQNLIDTEDSQVNAQDHLHNDFIDISLKFGLPSLILLFFIYFFLIYGKNPENRVLLKILMIMLISSQLTQSHFAHHQAITFFIVLFFLFQNKISSVK